MSALLWFPIMVSCTFDTEDIIEHIATASMIDTHHANIQDHCSVDFFHHNESFTENDETTNQRYTFTINDAYFFLSWTHLNEKGYSQIVGNIYNVQNPYLPIGDAGGNSSFLGITPFDDHGNNRNYHYVSTSNFRSKPDDIVFSFYNENNVEIHVFGSTKSHFYQDRFLWSPKIPIIAKSHHYNASNYNIIHQNIECIETEKEAFIIFVYEERYMVNGTELQYTNIYKSTFNSKYVVSHDANPINAIRGVASTPLVIQSLKSNHVIICYISNYRSIRCKLYSISISIDLDLMPFRNDTAIVTIPPHYAIKYYNLIPLSVSVGGYMMMYSANHQIYVTLVNENGDKYFENDVFIASESTNQLEHGQLIELDSNDACCAYVLMSYVSHAAQERAKLMAVVYHIDFTYDPPTMNQVGDIMELNSFPTNEEFNLNPNYECINYDEKSNMLVIGWLNNYRQFAYKPFRIKLPNLNYTHDTVEGEKLITTIPPSWTETQDVSPPAEVELESGLPGDMKIVLIVLCVAAFYCSLVGLMTFGITYLVRTGKLPFAIGYTQIHKQNNKASNREEDEEDFELEFKNDDKGGVFADDEQTVDEAC